MVIDVAVVEDNDNESALLESYLKDVSTDQLSFDIAIYSSAEDFLQNFKCGKFQLLFLDIQLPKIDGLTCARKVRETDENVILIFITSMAKFAISGYEVNAKDYILKPLIYDQFCRKMRRILPMVQRRNDNFIFISESQENPDLIAVDELMFVEVFGHKLIYHCKNRDYEAYGRISDVEEKLKSFDFLRCNRNTVINPKYIKHISKNIVEVGNTMLVISSPRKSEFLKELNRWMGK